MWASWVERAWVVVVWVIRAWAREWGEGVAALRARVVEARAVREV